MLSDPEETPVSAILYEEQGGRWVPLAVHASGKDYDFDWCRRDEEVYWHLAGVGPWNETIELSRCVDWRCRLWLAPGVAATVEGGGELVDAGYDLIDEPLEDPFKLGIEDETYWCETCSDRLPETNPCDHHEESP